MAKKGRRIPNPEAAAGAKELARLLAQCGCGPVPLTGRGDALYERHLAFDDDVAVSDAGPREPGVFAPLCDALLAHGDHYMHLADLTAYLEADERLVRLYADPQAWAGKAILNVAASGKFSSDRTSSEYAAEIWNAKPCPVF
jgi:hypothetical protein